MKMLDKNQLTTHFILTMLMEELKYRMVIEDCNDNINKGKPFYTLNFTLHQQVPDFE